MSDIKNALTRINYWFRKNHPAKIASLASGLSPLEIDNLFSGLSFKVSEEVREIYQWSNGYLINKCADDWIFDYMYLLSLESGVKEAQTWVEEHEEIALMYKYAGKPILPICMSDIEFLAVVATDDEQTTSPVIHISEIVEISLRYTNLTAMMLTIAESYETGGLFIGFKGYIEKDEKKYAAAYRKYNSGITNLALERFLKRFPEDSSWQTVELLHKDLYMSNSYGIEIPIISLKSKVVNTLLNLLQDEKYDSGFSVVLVLEELRAVDALIKGLQHPSKWVRSRAAFALGKIKAFEAVEFISQLLEDPDPMVQEAVKEALEMFKNQK
ncbi:MAG: HEAT repeat domain-containing protein [Nostoc sp.]|uniref:HEAT repeat domain-containing protein n=1 Tax=Nostoc sp. TaxID=1180 RepID=UPI002FF137F2